MKPTYASEIVSSSIAKSQVLVIDSADIIILRGISALDDGFDISENNGSTWKSVDARESVTITSGLPVHVRATNSSIVVEIERRFLSHFTGESGEKLSIATVKSDPITGNVTGLAGPDGSLMMQFVDVGGASSGTNVEI